MANNAYFATRQRGAMSVCGFAMSCEVTRTLCAIRLLITAPITGEFHGITVPIFGEGPPVLNE